MFNVRNSKTYYKNKYRPSIVYFHSEADLNVDQDLSSAVLGTFRPQPGEFAK